MHPHPADKSLDRRSFLARAGLGLGAAALSPLLARAQSGGDAPPPGKSLGVALVGLGGYAMGELAPALRKTQRCHLAALVTGTPEKRARYGQEYGIPDSHIYDYETFDRIADNPDVDIVYVVLPNSMHAEFSIRAAQAGKHVICEKPMAVSVAESEAMIAAAKKAGVSLNIGYRLHYDPYNQAIAALAKSRRFGAPKYVQAEFAFKTGNPDQWRLKKALAGGGAMMDVGIYCIQAARYATGEEPIAVSAREYKTDLEKFAEVDETIVWQMDFPSGALASATTSYNFRAERLHVGYANENATAELSPAYIYRGLAGRIQRDALDFGNPSQQAAHMDAVAASLQGGAPTTTGGDEGLRDMRIIEAIYESIAAGGKKVELT